MIRLTQHPPVFEEHPLDADVDMVNLVAAGFASGSVGDVVDSGGHVVDEAVDGVNGGPPPREDDGSMPGGEGSNSGDLSGSDTDDMDVCGGHTDGSS